MSANEPIDLDDLVLDERLQFRVGNGPYGTDRDTIERYSEAMADGAEFPAVGVIELSEGFDEYEMGTLLVYRGFHRICSAKGLGKGIIDCEVRAGTWHDARCLAFKENSTHGKPRSAKEIAKVLEAIKEDYPTLSDRQLATMAGCSRSSVWRWNKEKDPPKEAASGTRSIPSQPAAPNVPTVPTSSKQERREEGSSSDEEGTEAPSQAPADEEEIVGATLDEGEPVDEAPDPFAEVKQARQMADELVATLREVLRKVERMKQGEGGARIKFGVVEKAIEEARRHLDQFAPSIIVPSEVIESLGKDPTDGHGWLHKLGGSRLDPDTLAKCQKV